MSDNQFNTPNMRRKGGKFFFFALAFAGIALLMGAAVMWLWNSILPDVTGVAALTYWQAVGLLALCRILFGGFRGGNWKRKRDHLNDKWLRMSDEERARFREELQERCRRRGN